MKLAHILGAAALALPLTLSTASQAAVVSVDVNFLNGATSVSTLSFSYDDSSSGLLGYDDLLSFDLFTGHSSYDLAYVTGGGFSIYHYFGFDTVSQSFVTADIGGYPQILSAIAASFSSGFFYRDDIYSVMRDYLPTAPGEVYFTSIAIDSTVSPVPVPFAGVMMASGLGALAALRRRKSAAA